MILEAAKTYLAENPQPSMNLMPILAAQCDDSQYKEASAIHLTERAEEDKESALMDQDDAIQVLIRLSMKSRVFQFPSLKWW